VTGWYNECDWGRNN